MKLSVHKGFLLETGGSYPVIEISMDATECAVFIPRAIGEGEEEIAGAVGSEMDLQELKQKDTRALFRTLEDVRAGVTLSIDHSSGKRAPT